MKLMIDNQTKNPLLEFVVYDVLQDLRLNTIDKEIQITMFDKYPSGLWGRAGTLKTFEYDIVYASRDADDFLWSLYTKECLNSDTYLVETYYDEYDIKETVKTIAHELKHVSQYSIESESTKLLMKKYLPSIAGEEIENQAVVYENAYYAGLMAGGYSL